METKFISYSLDRARNGEHFEFINHFLSILTAGHATTLGIQPYYDTLTGLFAKEDEAIKQIQSYDDTQSINELDAERDELFRYLAQEVKNQQRSPIAARKTAATHLSPLMKTYSGAADKTQRDETGLLRNLIGDLESASYANDIAALSLSDVVSSMKTANDAFDTAFYQRVDEKDYRRASDSMKTIRPQVDKAYQDIIQMLNSLYNVYFLTPSSFSSQFKLLESLAGPLNASANDLKQSIIIRTGSGTIKPGGGGKPDKPNKPVDPKPDENPDDL